jgi:hypothetical protein
MPESLVGHRDPNPPSVPAGVRDLYSKNILSLLVRLSAKDEWGNAPTHILSLSPGATELWLLFSSELEPKLAPLHELGGMADWGGKLAGAVARIAGLLHMASYVCEDAPWEVPISAETMECAIVIGRYLIPHARAAYAEMGTDPAFDDARHVLAWIKRNEQPVVTIRDIFEGTKGRFKRVAELEKPLDILIERKYLRQLSSEQRQGPGRPPSPAFEVNPSLWADSANIANYANLENDGLKSLLEDSLSENKYIPHQEPGFQEPEDSQSGSQNSHNSQNWDAPQDAGEADSGELEEGII